MNTSLPSSLFPLISSVYLVCVIQENNMSTVINGLFLGFPAIRWNHIQWEVNIKIRDISGSAFEAHFKEQYLLLFSLSSFSNWCCVSGGIFSPTSGPDEANCLKLPFIIELIKHKQFYSKKNLVCKVMPDFFCCFPYIGP